MTGAGGGAGATDEIPEFEMENVQWQPGEPGRAGSKRIRDSRSVLDSYGFYGLTTAEKKPMLQPHDFDKSSYKAGSGMHMNSGAASKTGARYLHGTHGLETPDSNALRLISSSPGENPENKTIRATKICTLYAQGRCNKGDSCTFLHEREGLASTKAGLLAPAVYGNHRGCEEGSQVQHQSILKVPQFKDAEGSSDQERHRSLIHVYGKANERSAHLADKQSTPGFSQGLPGGSIVDSLTRKHTAPVNELVHSLAHEKNQRLFMGQHIGLAGETYLNGRSTFPRSLDGGNFQSGVDKRNSLSHVSGAYLDVNTLNPDHRFRSFGLSMPSDPLQFSEKLSAYGRTTEDLPKTQQKEHRSSHASYGSHSLTGFRNPGYAHSEISLGSPTLQATSQLGVDSHHLFTTGIEKVNLHRYFDKDCGTSRPALHSSSSPEPSILSAGPLSPIKDEVWETSVPFVPSFSFPDNTTPPGTPYDPFVDCMEPKFENANNLKSSNISLSISSQHTNQYVISDKSLNHDDELTRNMSAKGANGPASLIASDRGHSCSLYDNNRVKVCDKKIDAATNDFRFHLAEHIKELIKPIWKEGNLSKDAHKQVVKKSVEKVVATLEPNQVPTTKELIANYITTNGPKIEKLAKGYVDRYRKE